MVMTWFIHVVTFWGLRFSGWARVRLGALFVHYDAFVHFRALSFALRFALCPIKPEGSL